ncbi:hypothetical protein [Virgibacillus pantothenticus]|uniref:Lipoprotein n=1 Tax=Virgibacillus pantothenticus TaxID=1473 RepID=A0A0L0QKC4_VIRPA|nr:hypothetical protein [Virgibacillus pantothenticus]KNE19022.1 hypothetical protein AFK71_10665 [Virgibacillus pantothenticus]MED3737230.1 hypothetical protein [Virgibacillus pantothenticus]QTY15459.1 hypothetical protein KBP50_16435 [Virgibacillus pantothenticus]SIS81052.1 hypothetical protein SAMN05421787_1047 [Virgibacillus pantothenticus]
MKKVIIFSFLLIFLSACGNDLVHEDIERDYKQIEKTADKVYKSEKGSSEKQQKLFNDFYDKYVIGQFEEKNGSIYEMNDLEKDIIFEAQNLWIEAITSEYKENLVSGDTYKETKEKINEYLSLKKIPKELEGKHPTYELVEGTPEPFEKEVKELFNLLDIPMNSDNPTFTENEYLPLVRFLNKCSGVSYEYDGKNYYIESDMRKIVDLFETIQFEVDEEYLNDSTVEEFNAQKEIWDL